MLPMMFMWGVMVHEYGHLIALRLMGLDGVIKSTGLNQTWLLNGITPTQQTIWYLCGGLLQAIYGVYNMINESDNETWLSGFTVASQGIIYAFFEVANTPFIGAIFSIAITALIIILLQTEKMISFD